MTGDGLARDVRSEKPFDQARDIARGGGFEMEESSSNSLDGGSTYGRRSRVRRCA
jgi:hypothetical protein